MSLADLRDLDRGPGRRLLEATVAMGFSEPVARAGLDAELEAWRDGSAWRRLRATLPAGGAPSQWPRTVLLVAPSTLPAGTMRQVLLARALGARVLLKPATGQEALAEALAAADPAVEPRPFAAGDEAALGAAVAEAEAVVVLGRDATVEAVRRRVPRGTAFVGHGHRLSVAWLERADDAALEGLARDLCAWDQAGCLSPQVAWVRDDPERVADRLADLLRRVEADRPMAVPDAVAHGRAAVRALADATGRSRETATALLAAVPDPSFRTSPGGRTLWILPARDGAWAEAGRWLASIGYAGPPERAPAPEGVRVCPVGRMQRPPLDAIHDGGPDLRPLLRPEPEPGSDR